MLDDFASVLTTCSCILGVFVLVGALFGLMKLVGDAWHSDDWEV